MYKNLNTLLFVLVCSLFFAGPTIAQSLHVEWGYTPPPTPTVTGFKLYQEGVNVCSTQDAKATAMDCDVTLTAMTTNFTLTATFNDGTESPQSSPFAFTATSSDTGGGTATSLQATIQATPLTGTAPLTVNFNGASSTGTITQYQWDFADGSTSNVSIVDHQYTKSGQFLAKLTTYDASGASSSTSVTVNVTEPTTAVAPVITLVKPTAVVSSTAALGPAPLSVSFNGSTSYADGSATITNYAWSFGDGSTATGATTSHTYTAAGTYEATLVVTDSNGLTNSATTPVVVSAAVVNAAPTASICTATVSASSSLTVSFDGSCSKDSDGSIASYVWAFGDGSVGSGKTVTHTYTTAAEFTVTLQVTDDKGATGSTTTKITATNAASALNIETGEVVVTGSWVHVTLSNTYQNPIVLAGPPSFNNAAPGVIRLRNVTATGFDIKFTEWNYLDGVHPAETVSFIVLEKGHHALPDGSALEAGSFAGGTAFITLNYTKAFSKIPVVLTTVASTNETDTVSGRMKNITKSGFSYAFQEQEKNKNAHAKETVHYIAWEPGSGNIGSLQYQVGATAKAVTQAWYQVTFGKSFIEPPLVLADMQTIVNTDTCSLRAKSVVATGFTVKVEEEQSKDSEVDHPAETVGYISVSQE